MARGQVIELFLCHMGNHASMRVWPVEYDGKSLQVCGDCIDEAAHRGGMVDATELGGPKAYLPGPDIQVRGEPDGGRL